MADCKRCDGGGIIDCIQCYGSGKHPNGGPCQYCKGKREQDCYECFGTGRADS